MDLPKPENGELLRALEENARQPSDDFKALQARFGDDTKSEVEKLRASLGNRSIAEGLKRGGDAVIDPLAGVRSTLADLNLTQNKSLASLFEATGKVANSLNADTIRDILKQPEHKTIDFRPPPVDFGNEFKAQAQEQLRLAKSTEELTRAALAATVKRHEEERLDAITNSRELTKARAREWIAIGLAMLFGIIGAWEPVTKWLERLG